MTGDAAKILIVEDDPDLSFALRVNLEAEGYSCLAAATAPDAWETLVREAPTAAIVDLTLDGDPDWGLVERIRADAGRANLPVLITTGLVTPEVERRAEELGCRYFPKPFGIAELLDELRGLGGAGGA